MRVIIPMEVELFPLYCILNETVDSNYVVKLECPDGTTVSGAILENVEK